MAKTDPRDKDRADELERQATVEQAVHDATHGKDGEPIPIVLPEPPGVTVFEGKP